MPVRSHVGHVYSLFRGLWASERADLAGLGGLERECETVLGIAVVRGNGTGSGPKFREEISDGGAPNETLDRERRRAPCLRGGPAQR
jgi:hypothetical protein